MPYVYSPVLLVEGDGDQKAVPLLVRNIAAALNAYGISPAPRPMKIGNIVKLRRDGELERYISYGASRPEGDCVLLFADCDDDCPATVAREFLTRVAAITPALTKPVGIALFKKEFECLFLASLETIAARYPDFGWNFDDFDHQRDMETIRGAKGQLSKLMSKGRSYKETRDQPRFVSVLDYARLRNCSRSFRHCESLMRWMAGQIHENAQLYPVIPL